MPLDLSPTSAISLSSSRQKRIWLAVSLVVVMLHAISVGRTWAAWQLSRRPTLSALKTAVMLDRGNPTLHERLGMAYLSDSFDQESASRELETATRLNPHSATSWLELATVRQGMGDDQKAVDALDHAVAADPHSAIVAWYAASFWTVRNAVPKAIPFCHSILESHDSSNLPDALRLCWHATGGNPAAMSQLLPPDPDTYLLLIQQLVGSGAMQPAAAMWARLLALNKPIPLPAALPFVQQLIADREVPAAASTWREIGARDAGFAPYMPGADLVVNPGFELDMLNGGFDWQFEPHAGVKVAVDTSVMHSGRRSLLLVFHSSDDDDPGVGQVVAVVPHTTYELNGYMRTEELIGVSGLMFAVRDAYDKTVLASTSDLYGVNGWQLLRCRFTTGADQNAVRISLRHTAEGAALTGKAWIDDITLHPVTPARDHE
jgi:hypothetical protein